MASSRLVVISAPAILLPPTAAGKSFSLVDWHRVSLAEIRIEYIVVDQETLETQDSWLPKANILMSVVQDRSTLQTVSA